MATRFDEPVAFNAAATFRQPVTLPANCVGDANFTAASPLGVDKQGHQYLKGLAQVHGSAAAAERRVVHVARAAGVLDDFRAGVVVACTGNATVTVDLRKNGTTVLDAPIVLDNTNTAFAKEAAGVSAAADDYVAGDVFEVVVTVNAGTGALGQGLFAQGAFREAA